jgi:hypothetical protein
MAGTTCCLVTVMVAVVHACACRCPRRRAVVMGPFEKEMRKSSKIEDVQRCPPFSKLAEGFCKRCSGVFSQEAPSLPVLRYAGRITNLPATALEHYRDFFKRCADSKQTCSLLDLSPSSRAFRMRAPSASADTQVSQPPRRCRTRLASQRGCEPIHLCSGRSTTRGVAQS